MKKFLPWIFAAGLLITLAFLVVRSSDQRHQEVEYWVSGFPDDTNLSHEANLKKRVAALRQLGPIAVKALMEFTHRQDGRYNYWWDSFPRFLQRVLPRPKEAARTRGRAAYYLGQLGPEAKRAVPDLLLLLHDNEEGVRYVAALALGEIGPSSEEVTSAIKKLYQDPSAEVVFAAALSVWRMDREDSFAAALIELAITNDIPTVDSLGRSALSSIGKDACRFAPALAKGMCNAVYTGTKIATAEALWRLQGSPDSALYVLGVITNTLASEPPPQPGVGAANIHVVLAAEALIDVPEFRIAIKPHLFSLRNSPVPWIAGKASNCLYQIEQLDSGKGTER